ncbi:MAG: RNA methyltransferase [Proteobacteria bacterium]|nr:RNA methyltransferase [Pseudomonadota bacterium]
MTAVYCALVHYPVRDREGTSVTASITNLDVHDIARAARTYGLSGYFLITPVDAQRVLATRIIDHWLKGAGLRRGPERAEALGLCHVVGSIECAAAAIAAESGARPTLVATAASPPRKRSTLSFERLRASLTERKAPLLLLFGTSHGLALEVLDACDAVLEPIVGPTAYNHLSVRSAAAIVLDRLLGPRQAAARQ